MVVSMRRGTSWPRCGRYTSRPSLPGSNEIFAFGSRRTAGRSLCNSVIHSHLILPIGGNSLSVAGAREHCLGGDLEISLRVNDTQFLEAPQTAQSRTVPTA